MIKNEFVYLGWYLLLSLPVLIIYLQFNRRAKKEYLALTGQIRPKPKADDYKREYMRLESAVPVGFQKIDDKAGREFDMHQGFTKDISKGGICLETHTVHGKALEELVPDKTKLKLTIDLPSEEMPAEALVTVRWIHKAEDVAVDKYLMGVSFDEIKETDLDKVIRYALWFRRRPEVLAIAIIIILAVIAGFLGPIIMFKNTSARIEKIARGAQRKGDEVSKRIEVIKREKEKAEGDLDAISHEYAVLLERLAEDEKKPTAKKEAIPLAGEDRTDEVLLEDVDIAEAEEVIIEAEEQVESPEDTDLPTVELREPVSPEDEIVVEPNITRAMIESEKNVRNTLRDYILRDDIQLLERYTSGHKASIYHAAALFAIAEIRYKNMYMEEMINKAYRDVIRLYPGSKYASYASHRLEQVEGHIPYSTRSLRYYYMQYSLPPLLDYRELEPYKE